jgi:hypothetical protein
VAAKGKVVRWEKPRGEKNFMRNKDDIDLRMLNGVVVGGKSNSPAFK